MKVQNPILKGFNPDPCIIYAEGRFLLATSTFEYFPGFNIYQSFDLVEWELINRPLNTVVFLDMKGKPDSTGVWAPCLSYNEKLKKYFIVYSNNSSWINQPYKDCRNYIISADKIEGPWSEPVYINSSGFDASLFHDDDGKSYYMNMEWDHRYPGDRNRQFSGILLAEFDTETYALKEEMKKIFLGTERGCVEGPHIYKKDGWYYLITAEGGTSYGHAVTVARSKNVYGPYELHPDTFLVTSLGKDCDLQRAGHGSLCKDGLGNWYLAHLCGRPIGDMKCVLGRETAIQNVIWEDGFPYLADKINVPKNTFDIPCEREIPKKQEKVYTFNDLAFLKDFYTLRLPFDEGRFRVENGKLVIIGKESPLSVIEQSIVARRQEDFLFEAQCALEFDPTSFQHMAGLSYRYNEANQYYFYVSYDETLQSRTLRLCCHKRHEYSVVDRQPIADGIVYLKVSGEKETAQFSFSYDGTTFTNFGAPVSTLILSDEFANGFTGAFVGMMANDLKDHKKEAKFLSFRYLGKD